MADSQRKGRPAKRADLFWWLTDRDALLRRFILSQALGEPRCRRPRPGLWGGRGPSAPGGGG